MDKRIIECFATGSKSGIIPVGTIGYSQFAIKKKPEDDYLKAPPHEQKE